MLNSPFLSKKETAIRSFKSLPNALFRKLREIFEGDGNALGWGAWVHVTWGWGQRAVNFSECFQREITLIHHGQDHAGICTQHIPKFRLIIVVSRSLNYDLDRRRICEELNNHLDIFGINGLKFFKNEIIKYEQGKLLVTFILLIHFVFSLWIFSDSLFDSLRVTLWPFLGGFLRRFRHRMSKSETERSPFELISQTSSIKWM